MVDASLSRQCAVVVEAAGGAGLARNTPERVGGRRKPMRPTPAKADRLRREIEHHRDLAEQDAEAIWGWSSAAGERRADRRARLFVRCGSIRSGVRVLELGCGTGEFTRRVAPVGATLVGLDLSRELLEKARAKIPVGARFVRSNAEVLPFPDSTFDVVYGCSVLHHLDLRTALAEVRRVLRPGGRLVFCEPNLLNPQVWLMFKCVPLKSYFGVSPDEMAFTRRAVSRILERLAFARFTVRCFDFLHPSIPRPIVPMMEALAESLERIPVLSAISGSLLICGER